jgi:hypothetical protein
MRAVAWALGEATAVSSEIPPSPSPTSTTPQSRARSCCPALAATTPALPPSPTGAAESSGTCSGAPGVRRRPGAPCSPPAEAHRPLQRCRRDRSQSADLADRLPGKRGPGWDAYRYARNRYLTDPDILRELQDRFTEAAVGQAHALGLLMPHDPGRSPTPTAPGPSTATAPSSAPSPSVPNREPPAVDGRCWSRVPRR